MADQHLERAKRFNIKLIEFDENEEVICEIRKHPFGLLIIALTGFFIFVITLAVGTVVSLWLEHNGSELITEASKASWAVMAIAIVVSVIVALLTVIYGFVYHSNTMLVTTDKIAQTLYTNIFDRKISQLSIGDVQDVTVTQKGIIAQLFNFGTIVIETAGEQQNYTFTYAPHPYQCSKDIIAAHERSVQKYGN